MTVCHLTSISILDEKMETAERDENLNCVTKFSKLSKCYQDSALESLNGENWLNDDAISKSIFFQNIIRL